MNNYISSLWVADQPFGGRVIFDFRGTNLLVGENGTGKSTILEIIKLVASGSLENAKREIGFIGTFRENLTRTATRFDYTVGFLSADVGLAYFSSAVVGEDEFLSFAIDSLSENRSLIERLPGGFESLPSRVALSTLHVLEYSPLIGPVQEFRETLALPFDAFPPKAVDVFLNLKSWLFSICYKSLFGSQRLIDRRELQIKIGMENLISQVSGRNFEFVLSDEPDKIALLVVWDNILMSFATLPDGLRALIVCVASFFCSLHQKFPKAKNPLLEPCIVTMDEPENHLHAKWQRQFVPTIQSLLPKAQIFVATHSPFIISSVNSGTIHQFYFSRQSAFDVAIKSTECGQGDSYIDAVEEALGLKERYDPETERLLADFYRIKKEAAKSPEYDSEMRELADKIRQRSQSLNNIITSELRQFDLSKEKHAKTKTTKKTKSVSRKRKKVE